MATPVRAALYLRVSTGRQADNDLSIPDQRRQAKAHCASRGWEIVADYVEPGASATDDRRPEFQRMIDAATTKPAAFDVILVHSFSRFFRDQFQLEFAKLKRLYDAIENGVADLTDPMLKDRIAELKAIRDQAHADAERAEDALERVAPSITPQALKTFASQARRCMRSESGGYRRDHLRALAQRVEVDAKEIRIMGSKSVLLRTLFAASRAKSAVFGVPSFVPKWRALRESNPCFRRERAMS
jgi:hypothetical protein